MIPPLGKFKHLHLTWFLKIHYIYYYILIIICSYNFYQIFTTFYHLIFWWINNLKDIWIFDDERYVKIDKLDEENVNGAKMINIIDDVVEFQVIRNDILK